MKFFREPALILAALSSLITVAGTLGLGLSPEAAALWSGLTAAVFGVGTAIATKPIMPGAFLTFVGAAMPVLSLYGFNFTGATIAAVNAAVVALVAAIFRGQITPAYDARPEPTVVL